jgi:hypothetical protein
MGVMLAGRSVAVALCLLAPVAARSQTAGEQTAPTSPAQTAKDDIIVSGTTAEKKSDWKRADSEHVVIFSTGSEAELRRVTRNIERLYYLMSRIYRGGDYSSSVLPLQVTLIDSSDRLRALNLANLRSDEGPYRANFVVQRYYDPGEDGPVLAVARSDQLIDLNTNRRFNEECDKYHAEGGQELCGAVVDYRRPVSRSWEAVLYSAYAQHFILTYAPAAYPRWYLDGIGALFSTITVRDDGKLDYAVAPSGYGDILASYGRVKVSDVLAGQYLATSDKDRSWTPYHAWLLAHFFLFSERGAKWNPQFRKYMAAIHQGVPMPEAVKAFGDMTALQRDFIRYVERPTSYARAEPPLPPGSDPLIVTLSASSAALIEARLELGAGDSAGTPAEADGLKQVRAGIAQAPYNLDAMLFLTEIECREGRPDSCLDMAEDILARSPDDARALAWKGIALTDKAFAGDAAARPEMLAAARATLERAIERDGQASLPRIAYFQSFVRAGKRVPEKAMAGMALVVRNIPAAPAPRLYLGEELVRQGQADLARRLLNPVLYGGYDSPERKAAERLFQSGGARPTEG